MRKRHEPYIPEAHRASMMFEHAAWRTHPVRAGVGLRQGCSASPVIFRWVMSDCLERPGRKWETEDKGVMLQPKVLTHLAWADDKWLWAASLESLIAMLQDVAEAVYREIWLISVGKTAPSPKCPRQQKS